MINTVCKELKYKRKQCGLAMSTGVQQPSARFCQVLPGSARFWMDYYTLKVTAAVFVTFTAADIEGADLSEPLVLFWHRHQEAAWNKLATATFSWLSFITDMLSHLTLLSRPPGN